MLEFSWRKRDKNNVPVMSAKEMDELAELLINDYKPALIKEPQPINYEHFLEVYLGVNLQYTDITADASILGMIAFDDGRVPVYDNEVGREKSIEITEGTVLIDNHLLASDKVGRLRFTALHEGGGHWWCHRGVYAKNKGQLSLDFIDNQHRQSVIKCRVNSVENFAYRRHTTSEDWMEYQADYMASAIAMPKTPFKAVAQQVLSHAGITNKRVIIGEDSETDLFAMREFPSFVADIFKVSRQAAEIKLKNFGFIKDRKTIKQEVDQYSFFY
ncbi:ImmA/IrrE family metallo-endopeptidase [Desulfosporosinus sp.]|uniref:ImmA/IrrE family metallo-endopeptidase n=1 Tax=Desulfosporosinus sp. TaxID=157907 RepID=UPI0025B973FA|nr:ImmA/IrrE family metallo-endopeptidase [Desulfosporosinus sp.]MBC2727101.1 ImmA/IrrE family metallo-endopeptidase [Desulfosporosinus sp.]